jgi:tRNA(Ile)-lysidine synthetase-like protein
MIKFNKKIINTSKNDTLFCAVSMGEDSVALSHYLALGFRKLCLIHVNHGTEYSNIAQAKFEQYVPWLNSMKRSKYPITGIVKTNTEYTNGMSESVLRDIRYNLITDAVRDNGLSDMNEVVVCHHLGDCVESYLMNCFNGVPEYKPIPVTTFRSNNCKIVRPFVSTSKKSITRYIDSHNIRNWVIEDPSNSDVVYSRRNWLRHQIIPQIEKNYKGLETVVRKKVELI